MWSRQDSSESNGRGPDRPGGCPDRFGGGTTATNGDVDDRAECSRHLGTLNYLNNGELISGIQLAIHLHKFQADISFNKVNKMRRNLSILL
jgi:hypothetical protein